MLGCQVDGDPLEGYAEVKVGTAIIALHCGAGDRVGRHGGTLFQLTTEDVDAEVAAIRARGGVVAAGPNDLPWGRLACVADPRAIMVEIYSTA